jgi:hypothetical protein
VKRPPSQQLEVRTPVVAEDDQLAVDEGSAGGQRADDIHTLRERRGGVPAASEAERDPAAVLGREDGNQPSDWHN